MIEGRVRAILTPEQTEILQACIPLVVHSPAGKRWEGEAIVDTGFSDSLALAHEVIRELALQPYEVRTREMADGRKITVFVYKVAVQWYGKAHTIPVFAMERTLVGAGLLKGYAVSVDMVAEGQVVIRELS
jgi:clan AA aspartic protease